MEITTKNFDSFSDGSWDYNKSQNMHTGIFLSSADADIGGGRITTDDIDILKNYPKVNALSIMGLTQSTFEYFIKNYGKQLKAIRFFKNKLIEDWSLLGELPELEFVYFYHNQRITNLWNMRKNTSLKGLNISDFSRLKSIKGIETAPALQIFKIGDAVWSTTIIDSFMPLSGTKIKHLSFYGKKIEDNDLSYILKIKSLETFDFPANLFSTEQVAWIVANRPDLKGFALKPTIEYMSYNTQTGKSDIPCSIVVGKKKPSLKVETQSDRIEKYSQIFYHLAKKYRNMPYKTAFPLE